MIKIIKGSYGMRCGALIKAISAGSDPIELSKEQEERLVRLGVAEYVGDCVAEDVESDVQTEDEIVDEFPEYNADMKLADLKKVAEAYGVDASSMRTKKDVIEAIDAARNELPDFDAADAVQ